MRRTFLLLGSGEFEPWTHDVESRVLADATGDGSVVILPTASATEGDAVFDRWGRMGLDHYAEVDLRAEVLPVKRREDAFREELAERVGGASLVYFSGGKPQHLANVLPDTPLLDVILRALDRRAVWGGCSAGAMVVSRSRGGSFGAGRRSIPLGGAAGRRLRSHLHRPMAWIVDPREPSRLSAPSNGGPRTKGSGHGPTTSRPPSRGRRDHRRARARSRGERV